LSVKIKRYEQALSSIAGDSLPVGLKALQSDYYLFLGDDPSNPENVLQIRNYLNDKIIKQLYKDVQKQYPDLSDMEEEFASAFALLKYYFPKANPPQIYTAITGLYYEMPVMFYDSVLVISLDMYLGRNYKLYKQLGPAVPQFIRRRFSKEFILPDCFKEIAWQYINYQQGALLDAMISEGKRLLFAELMLPNAPDSLIFPFPQQKIQWLKDNEAAVWGYLIEKKYLYSKDNVLIRKLISETPFTSFFGNQSPGKAGVWTGWQICRSWMQKNPDKTLADLMTETDAQKILMESKYKPKK
jgi:hypothetical protein